MNKKGLTLTVVFEAESANYGEGVGNIASLKRISRAGGKSYSYISRQALRYSLMEQLNWNNTPVTDENKVVQFSPKATITEYPEIDLFGYMKTAKDKGAETRSAVARLSNAVSLEPYQMDMDFLTNMGMAKRGGFSNAIAQAEIHRSYYSYTLTLDLDRVGIDRDEVVPVPERANRVNHLLMAIEHLYRDIKGRRENLSPVFVAGGVYERKSPFFENRIRMQYGRLNCEMVLDTAKSAGEGTLIGYLQGGFANDAEVLEKLAPMKISEFFEKLRKDVTEAYKGLES